MNEEQQEQEMSDEEAIMRIASAMKDNAPVGDDRHNVHTFLNNVVHAESMDGVMRTGNLRDDNELNELGVPQWNVRGALGMARIADKIMDNEFFKEYFEAQAKETLGTSLSREGFIIRTATTTTKQIVDATKKRKINKGMFGQKTTETQGGDILSSNKE